MDLLSPTLPRSRPASSTAVPSRPVRVCFLIDRLSRAGTETQLLALIREIDRRRVEPTLVLLHGEDAESRSLEPADCPVLRLGVSKLISRNTITAARRFRQFLHIHQPDLIQAYFMDSAYFGVPVARWCGVRKVVRVRNNLGYWLTRKHRLLNRLVDPWVDTVLTNSEEGKRAILDRDGLSPDRVEVIANGVDLDRFADASPPFAGSGSVRIGCVANLRPVKNIDGLIRAARIVCDRFPDIQFEVAGDGPERAALERLIVEQNLGERFALRGTVSDVPAFLRSIDVVVLPSHSEGMSNALLESMAAGRAIVATAVGANAFLLDHGQAGRLVPARDDSALADAISALIADPSRASRLAAAARDRAKSEFSRSAMCRRFEEFYLRLARQS